MARQRIAAKTKTYNFIMPWDDWLTLSKIAHQQSREQGKQVSVAQLVRYAYKAIYYEELE